MTRSLLTLITLAVVSAGCGAFSGTIEYSDPRADAAGKSFAVLPGKGNIYVYRNQVYLRETPLEVILDERWTGRTLGQTYFLVEVDTGMHVLRAKGDTEARLDVMVGPGQNVFVWLQVSPSLQTARGTMQVKVEGEGRAGVLECRRVEAFE
jgi:hypothetical protein